MSDTTNETAEHEWHHVHDDCGGPMVVCPRCGTFADHEEDGPCEAGKHPDGIEQARKVIIGEAIEMADDLDWAGVIAALPEAEQKRISDQLWREPTAAPPADAYAELEALLCCCNHVYAAIRAEQSGVINRKGMIELPNDDAVLPLADIDGELTALQHINPSTVLGLIAENRALRAKVAELEPKPEDIRVHGAGIGADGKVRTL